MVLTHGRILDQQRDADGTLHLTIASPYQPAPTTVRILQPRDAEARHVLWVLPVEPGIGGRYGDGLTEMQEHDLHHRHGFTVISPSFAQMPWYIDHPTDTTRQQESHIMRVLLPLVDAALGREVGGRGGRLVLGFSKSGWGAVSLLLRHPEAFDAAALWDAPLMAQQPVRGWDIEPLLAGPEDFARHALPARLREHGQRLNPRPRLVLLGGGHHAAHMAEAHALLTTLPVAHRWIGPVDAAHTWHSGWVEPAAAALMEVVH